MPTRWTIKSKEVSVKLIYKMKIYNKHWLHVEQQNQEVSLKLILNKIYNKHSLRVETRKTKVISVNLILNKMKTYNKHSIHAEQQNQKRYQ